MVREEIETRLPALTRDVNLVTAALGNMVADIGALSLVMPPEWIAPWRTGEPWEKLQT